MSIWQELLLLVVGLLAGYINVMAGGGSLLTIPAMLFMGLPAPVANGTNRIAIIAQSIASSWVFFRKGLTELRLSCTLALFTLPGALAGALLGVRFEGPWFNRVLALIMLLLMLAMAWGKPSAKTSTTQNSDTDLSLSARRFWLAHLLMIPVGFYAGLIQVGIGFVIMFVLHRVMGLDLLRVNMHKVFLVLPFTVVSLAVFASYVDIYWRAGLFLAVGNAMGGWLATHMMIRKGEKIIKVVFNGVLFMLIIKLLFF